MSDQEDSSKDTNEKPEDQIGKAILKITEKLQDKVTDLTTLDVTTYVGNPSKVDVDKALEKDLKFNELKDVYVAGFTRLDIDGDIIELLNGDPTTGKISLDKEILDIHKQNVSDAVDNWNKFFKNLLTITATIWSLAKPDSNRVAIIEALRDKIEPIEKPVNDNKQPSQ